MITSNQENNSLTNSVNLILPTVPPLMVNSEGQQQTQGIMQNNYMNNNNLSSNLSGASSSPLANNEDDSQTDEILSRNFQNELQQE